MNIKELLFGKPPAGEAQPAHYQKSTQAWIPVADIQQGMVITKGGRFVKILEILPVNFELKSPAEQKNIIISFTAYLKIAPNHLQILAVTRKSDADAYEDMMRRHLHRESEEGCAELIEDNIREIRRLTTEESITHRFFLAFSLEPDMKLRENTLSGIAERLSDEERAARRYLSGCGLEIITPDYSDNQQLSILYELLNPRTSRWAKLPLSVFDMVTPVLGAAEEELDRRMEEELEDEIRNAILDEGESKENSPAKRNGGPKAYARAEKRLKRLRKKRREKPPELTPMEEGSYSVLDILAPSSLDLTGRDYIVIDGTYQATLYITGYGYRTAVHGGWLNLLIEAGEGIHVSFSFAKQPRDRMLSKIGKTVMVNRSRMRDVGDARQDFEELDSAIDSGLFLKAEMNRNGEDFYYMTVLFQVSAESPEQLEQRVEALETHCASLEFQVRRADYVHSEGYLSCLPLLSLHPDLERKAKRNILTRDLAASFPFSSYEICDPNGIFLGLNLRNRSVCRLDIFDSEKYESANFMIFGRTGAGKTHLEQCIALRYRETGIPVLIVVPEKGHEYRPACEAVGGQYIRLAPGSPDCVNWMQIRKRSLDANARIKHLEERNDSLLAEMIERLHLYFSLRIPNLTNEDQELLDTSLVECYGRFGITFDNRSLLEADGMTYKPQPDFHALYRLFMERPETRKFATAISRFVTGSAASMGGQTNVNLDSKYIVMDISAAGKDLMVELMYWCMCLGIDMCYDDISSPKVILMDELWRLIGSGSNARVAERVLEMFKIIRGLGGSIIGSTQDISDGEGLEDGKYARGILNACRFKIVLALEEQEALRVQEVLRLSGEETLQILRSHRGEGLLCAGNNRIPVAFYATAKEHEMITTSRLELARQKAEG